MGKTVLVTGGTGLLGEALRATLPGDWSIVSAHRRTYAAPEPRVTDVVADVRDRAALERLFASCRLDAVVHAAGIASVDYSEQHPEESEDSNLGGTRAIAELCQAHGVRLVYVSTNAVFDGRHAPYRESDAVSPVNTYGRIKVKCERVVIGTVARPAIVRPILMYGWPHPMGRPNPVTWVVDALERGETIHVVDDVIENPLYNVNAARAIWSLLGRDLEGIFHLAGGDVVNRYEFALKVADVFGLDRARITPVPSDYFPSIAPRPKNTTLATDRMEHDLGVVPDTLEHGLRAMAATRLRDRLGAR